MFTGIIETVGTITRLERQQSNLVISITSSLSSSLKVDQSVAHDGVCLTVVHVENDTHTVVAVKETLSLTNLHEWEIGTKINLERAMILGHRLDGHLVQGHVDAMAEIVHILDQDGSYQYTFDFEPRHAALLIQKGSVAINGVSLTVINPSSNRFSVAIIPYTYSHTNFHQLGVGSTVNLEFDAIGKYVLRAQQLR